MNLIDFGVLIPFALITTFSPGPNNLSTASMSINYGIKRTMNYIFGVVTGFFFRKPNCLYGKYDFNGIINKFGAKK